MNISNPFLLGRLKTVDGSSRIPYTSDNRVVVQFVPLNGEYEKVPRNTEISSRWEKARSDFRAWWQGQVGFKLGEMREVQVQSDTTVVSLIVHDGRKFDDDALVSAFEKLGKRCAQDKSNVHINISGPKKSWAIIEKCIENSLLKSGVNVFLYKGSE